MDGMTAELQAIVDRHGIHEAILAHARGIDRLDLEELRRAYWDDAIFDDKLVQGPFREWGPLLIAQGGVLFEATQHNVLNLTTRIDGNRAQAESYILSYHRTRADRAAIEATIGAERFAELGGDATRCHEFLVGGRNLDVLEKRDGTWKILRRRIAFDWNHTAVYSGITRGGMYDVLTLRGCHGHADPAYHW